MTLSQRFWSKVDRSGTSGCWVWMGARNHFGYGIVKNGPTMRRAHRVVWEDTHGPIPPGLNVLHSCDNPPCVNPDHLRVGTQTENIADAKVRKRHFTPFLGQEQAGEANRYAKLTDDGVRTMRARFAAGESREALAEAFGVTPSNVSYIVRRKTWKHVD